MSLIHNERVKLLAGWLDRASTAALTVGVLAPMAGYLYGATTITLRPLVTLSVIWLVLAGGLHALARFALGRLK